MASDMSVKTPSRMAKVSTEQVLHYEAALYSDSSTKILMEILSQIGVSLRGANYSLRVSDNGVKRTGNIRRV